MKVTKIRFPETSGIGIKPISREGTERLVRAALRYAKEFKRRSVTLVHKGNILKFTEGAFRDWGYALAAREFRADVVTERESWILGNREKDSAISVEDNARAIDPGYDLMTDDQKAKVPQGGGDRAGAAAHARRRQVEGEDPGQGRDRRHHPAAGADPAPGLRRAGHCRT